MKTAILGTFTVMQTLKPTDVIDGRYEVVEVLGTGAFGTVYKARQTQIDRMVAIKVLSNAVDSPEENARFEREAKAISVLQHKNIVGFYGYGFWRGAPYMVTELAQGRTLYDELQRQAQLDRARCIKIILPVLSALSCAHQQGIIHRDLKPHNIMLVKEPDGSESVKVIDFGLAKLLPGYGVPSQKLTETGFAIGTCQYMSPEQCTGAVVDGRADLYSAGCILYQCLTGKVPFDAADAVEIMYQHLSLDAEPLRTYLPDDPTTAGLQNFCDNCLAKDPDMRYANADEALRDISAINAGQSSKVKVFGVTTSSTRRHTIKKKEAKRAWLLPVVGLTSVVMVGLVATLYFHQAKPVQQKHDPAPVATAFPQVLPADLGIGDEELELAKRIWKDLTRDLELDAKEHHLDASQRAKMAALLCTYYQDRKNLKQAEKYAEIGYAQRRLAARYPERCRSELIEIDIALGKFNRADELVREAMKDELKMQLQTLQRVARSYCGASRADRCRRLLESILGMPDMPDSVRTYTYYYLGDTCLWNGREREAQAFYQRGIDTAAPEDEDFNPNWLGLSRLAFYQKNPQSAHEYLRHVDGAPLGAGKDHFFPEWNALMLCIADAAHQRDRKTVDAYAAELGRLSKHAWARASYVTVFDDNLAVKALVQARYTNVLELLEPIIEKHRHWEAQRDQIGRVPQID